MNEPVKSNVSNAVLVNEGFEVDASALAPLLGVSPSDVPLLLRNGEVTSIVERGEDEHAGTYRLTFFYRRIRARLVVDLGGRITRRSSIDYGDLRHPNLKERK